MPPIVAIVEPLILATPVALPIPAPLIWAWVMTALHLGVAIAASGHAILYKRDVRAAIGWTGLIWLAPFVGSLLYWLLGINRIRRRAVRLEHPAAVVRESARVYIEGAAPESAELQPLVELVARATGYPLVSGNRVVALSGGDAAYPAMLEAIAAARRSILFTTYIFDHDRAGTLFLDAFAAAKARGVEVRVLIDGVGARYSRPRMTRELRRRGVAVAEFLATTLPIPSPYFNLRNHRKILVVDGKLAFTGGMNIREGCLLGLVPPPRHPIADLHFELAGPVVAQIFAAGAFDWHFATGERLDSPAWALDTAATSAAAAGGVEARAIAVGPDEEMGTLEVVLHGALATARSRVCVVTPYFLPDHVLVAALRLAALRGVRVDIVLPDVNNLRFVQWASTAQLRQVLDDDCAVWLSPPPFDHSKIMVIDHEWSLVGSANWDARSLRLNFEIDVECYDHELAHQLEAMVEQRIANSRPLRRADLDARPLPIKLRDGVARLFAPYL